MDFILTFLTQAPDVVPTAVDSVAIQNIADSLCNADNDALGFWDKVYYCNSVKNWLFFLLTLLGAFIASKLLYWASGKFIKALTEKTKTKLDDLLVDMLEEPIVVLLVGGALLWGYDYFISYEISKPEAHNFITSAIAAFFTLVVTWMLARTIDALIEQYVVPLTEKSESDLDDQVLPLVRKGLKIIVWVIGILIALQNAGFNITALIASLGVGGLAVALAAQDTVKNLFGGVMIFADKPFMVKDRIVIEGIDGVVEEIGIRSTRVRTLQGRLVTIPNGKFSDNNIENVSSEPNRKVVLNIGLIYDTTPEQIKQAIDLLKKIGTSDEDLEEDILVSFNAFGDFSLGILFIYYIKKESDILDTQTNMNLEILTQFSNAGLEMAFPTQTVYTIPQNTTNPTA